MKRSLVVVPSVLAVLLAGAVIAPSFIDWNSYKTQIRDAVKTQTGLDLTIDGKITAAILPTPHAAVEGIRVAAPHGSANPVLFSAKQVNVNLGLAALLGGRIDVDSLKIVEPVIALEILQNGRGNWMTPELEAKTAAPASSPDGAPAAASPAVSLDHVEIVKGSLSYTARRGEPLVITDAGLTAGAGTLRGPFWAQGAFRYADQAIAFKAKTEGTLEENSKSVTLRIEAETDPSGVQMTYKGLVDYGTDMQAQGQLDLAVKSLNTLAGANVAGDDSLKVTGVITASPKAAEIRDATFAFGGNTYTGKAGAVLEPLRIAADITAARPVMGLWKRIVTDAKIETAPGRYTLKDTSLKLDDTALAVSGSYAAAKLGARAHLVADVAADRFDFDALSGGGKPQQKAQQKSGQKSGGSAAAAADSVRALALPFDADFDLGVQQARMNGLDVKGLRAQGMLRENALTLKNLSAQDFGGAAFTVDGAIGDLKGLSGINLRVKGKAADARGVAKTFGLDASTLPESVKALALDASAKGSSAALDVDADIGALNGTLGLAGKVADPLGAPSFSGVALDISHPNLAEAIRALSPASPRYASLASPFKFSAQLDSQGTKHNFRDLKATLGGSPVTGTLSVDTQGPAIAADLVFENLTIRSDASSGGSAGGSAGGSGGSAGGGGGNGKWSSETIDTGWMNSSALDLKIKANSIVYEGWDLKSPVISLAVGGGKLDVRQFESDLFGGRVNLDAAAQAGAGGKGFSSLTTNADLRGVAVESLVKALAGNAILRGQGTVNMKTALSTSGGSQAALVSALQGNGTTDGKDIVLEGFDLTRFASALSEETKPGDTLLGLWKGSIKGGSTAFDTLDGAFTVNQGVADITKLDLDGPKALLTTKGQIRLPPWTIETAHTITLKEKPDVPPFTIRIAGPLDNPAQTFGQGAINDYLQRKLNRKINNFIMDKLGDKLGLPPQQAPVTDPAVAPDASAPAPSPPPVTPEDAVKDLLKGILQ